MTARAFDDAMARDSAGGGHNSGLSPVGTASSANFAFMLATSASRKALLVVLVVELLKRCR